MNDLNIIKLYNDRDESAISETKKKYVNYCYTIAYNILGNPEDTNEVLNDTYLAVWKAIPPEKPRSFSSFIGRITRNIALNCHRSRSAVKRSNTVADISLSELDECIPSSITVETQIDKNDLTRVLNEFLDTLSVKDRQVFVRRYWYFDKVSDIAKRYGYSQSKVKMILLRTREKLAEKLRKEEIK